MHQCLPYGLRILDTHLINHFAKIAEIKQGGSNTPKHVTPNSGNPNIYIFFLNSQLMHDKEPTNPFQG